MQIGMTTFLLLLFRVKYHMLLCIVKAFSSQSSSFATSSLSFSSLLSTPSYQIIPTQTNNFYSSTIRSNGDYIPATTFLFFLSLHSSFHINHVVHQPMLNHPNRKQQSLPLYIQKQTYSPTSQKQKPSPTSLHHLENTVSVSEKLSGITSKYGNNELVARMKRSRTKNLGIETSARGERRYILKVKS